MAKKMAYLALAFFAASCFIIISIIYAQGQKEDLKAKIRDLRERKALLTIGYEEEIHKLNKATEEKMAKIKADFRIARDGCLKEKNARERELHKDYESKLMPMIKEEEGLIKEIGPSEEGNFARTKAERMRRR
jgi:hypothetical protein